jgi:hypothetical protein
MIRLFFTQKHYFLHVFFYFLFKIAFVFSYFNLLYFGFYNPSTSRSVYSVYGVWPVRSPSYASLARQFGGFAQEWARGI